MTEHVGLPVSGYKTQSTENVSRVNIMKQAEEEMLRRLDELAARKDIDQRWLAIGRTQMEQAFMAINRSVFQPTRIGLPND